MDPQLQAVRAARAAKFKAAQQQQTSLEETVLAEAMEAEEAVQAPAAAAVPTAPSTAAAAAAGGRLDAKSADLGKKRRGGVLDGIPLEMMGRSIASLLADAPPSPPKRLRRLDPGAVSIPKAATEEIRRLLSEPSATTSAPCIITWNIDGLDEVGGAEASMLRTLAVARDVARLRPVAVLLQEVVPLALQLLSAEQVLGSAYDVVVPDDPPMPYYVAILLDKRRAKRRGDAITLPFPTTRMGRQLLTVIVSVDGHTAPLLLATAHLESTKDNGLERKRQLAKCLRYCRNAVDRTGVGTAIFGGDLNVRDEEVKSVLKELGPSAQDVADVWNYCGSPQDQRWTWDTVANDNVAASFSCRCRFDRLFFISPGAASRSTLSTSTTSTSGATLADSGWRPTSFSLIGKERVASLGRFPSDHWGLVTSWTSGESATAAGNAVAAISNGITVLSGPAADSVAIVDVSGCDDAAAAITEPSVAGRPGSQEKEEAALRETLGSMGFGAADVAQALTHCSTAESAIEWLLARTGYVKAGTRAFVRVVI